MIDQLPLANPLCLLLDKDRGAFTRQDLLEVVRKKGIERFTFHYTALDGQLKEMRLPFGDLRQAERILASGERVDGSSLLRGLVDAAVSDLYVVPSYSTAFLNPFDPGSLDFICRFLDREGNLARLTPDNILTFANRRFHERTGLDLLALAELEFFLVGPGGTEYYTRASQTGYHSASPFVKGAAVVDEMVRHVQQITGAVKYAHAEVGYIQSVRSDNPILAGSRAEQHEIEFLTRPLEEMGDSIALARWLIRNVAFRHGMMATFAPKLEEGVAGNGFHIHVELTRDGRNIMSGERRGLSDEATKLIGGMIHYASTLSAFGNTEAAAFLRLVPNQEAPTRICWGHSNRSVLIRVPLGWRGETDLARQVNPHEPGRFVDEQGRQTVEIRSPDGSALFHLLLAGLAAAADHGLTADGMLELADRTYVEGNIFKDPTLLERLEALPGSCVACARLLRERRGMYESSGVFPPSIIDYVADLLQREGDEHLNRELSKMPAEERLTATRQVMHRDLHRH